MGKNIEKCPVCGEEAFVSHKWVLNKYGKRYDYFIYHHKRRLHYFNQNSERAKEFKKGELEKVLMEIINSQDFKLGSFRIMDVRKLLVGKYPRVGFGSIKTSLNKLVALGILEKQKSGRNLIFINTVSKERLNFIIDSISISLEDIDDDGTFKRHIYVYKVKNDRSWPLYFIPFRAVGDKDISFDQMDFRAEDPLNGKGISVFLVEDAPKDKRVLLRLPAPLFPGESIALKIIYNWAEPGQTYVFSAATKMNNFEFSLSSNRVVKLMVLMTSSSSNETQDFSSKIKEISSQGWRYVKILSLSDIEAFTFLQMKWR